MGRPRLRLRCERRQRHADVARFALADLYVLIERLVARGGDLHAVAAGVHAPGRRCQPCR